MTFRNLSPQEMFTAMALEYRPEYAFKGETRQQFDEWKAEALPKVLETLGDSPESVAPNPYMVAEWEHEGLRKQRWLIDVGRHISAAFQINYPSGLAAGEKRPAILCWHGHGARGKEAIMGNDSSPELKEQVERGNSQYGHAMAKAGFITFAIDWMGIGERGEHRPPNFRNQDRGRDWCNLYYLHATMFGMTPLSMNLKQGRGAIDFACTLPGVDEGRLGVMGASGGGTMTLWTALTDERFKAAEIIVYSDLFASFGFHDVNYCGSQITPGLYRLVDLPDLQGLLAPRPLLVDIGVHDTCFRLDGAIECYRGVKKIYDAAGATENLELDLAPREHGWGGNRSLQFFGKHLDFPTGERN